MNPLLSALTGKGGLGGIGGGCIGIIMKAVGAAKRGDSPTDFLKDLAKTRPELQGLDLDDLEATADLLAKKKGKSLGDIKAQAEGLIKQYM